MFKNVGMTDNGNSFQSSLSNAFNHIKISTDYSYFPTTKVGMLYTILWINKYRLTSFSGVDS